MPVVSASSNSRIARCLVAGSRTRQSRSLTDSLMSGVDMILKWFGVLVAIVLLNPFPAGAQGLIGAAMQAKDLTFPTAPTTLSGDGSRMTLLKPEGSGPFPAMVLHHQCDGLRHRNGPNRSMATWAQTAVRQGFVVLLIDLLGPRDVDLVCLGPKNGVNLPRGVRDAMQAADHLRTLPFIDKRRVAHVGFSWGAMVALLASNSTWRSVLPGSEAYTAAVQYILLAYGQTQDCLSIRSRSGPY